MTITKLNIWDWELLGSNEPNRKEIWGKIHKQKMQELENTEVTNYGLDARFLDIYNHPIFRAIAELQNFWLRLPWFGKHGLVRGWYQNLNRDKRYLTHGRARLYLLPLKFNLLPILYASWTIPSKFCHVYIDIGGEDRAISLAIACNLFAIWLAIENCLPKGIVNKISPYGHERRSGISYHNKCIFFSIWRGECDHRGWKGAYWSFNLRDFIVGKPTYEHITLGMQRFIINISGVEHPADIELFRSIERRRWTTKEVLKVEITLGVPVPMPAKDDDYDYEEDAIFSTTMVANDIETAIARFIKNVEERRIKYGGENWKPSINQ